VRESYHTSLLSKFCKDNDLHPVVSHSVSCVDYTYHFNMSRFSVLDHFILPDALYENTVDSVYVEHSVDNTSDHEPLFLRLKIPSTFTSCFERVFTKKTAWSRLKPTQSMCLTISMPYEQTYIQLLYQLMHFCVEMCLVLILST